MKPLTLPLLLGCLALPAMAANDFGTKDEARQMATQIIDIVNESGVSAAVQAIIDPNGEYRQSPLGINLFNGTVVVADNREPESVATDYSDITDLTGELVWGRISAAADIEDDAELLWYHYDTQEVYTFQCFAKRAQRDDSLVMVCR